MRLFVAIDLPQEILLRLERLVAALRPEAMIKWSPLDNLHITTKFIGEWPEDRLGQIDGALRGLTAREPFEVSLQNLGWFPNERAPRVLWSGVQGGSALQTLAADTEETLAALGIKRELRPFSPHLTLARIKGPTSLRRLKEKVKELEATAIGSFAVSRFSLFRSDPGSNASIYRALGEYSMETLLAAAAGSPK